MAHIKHTEVLERESSFNSAERSQKKRRNKDIILAGATNKKQRDNRVYTRYSSSTGAVGAGADDVYTCDIS